MLKRLGLSTALLLASVSMAMAVDIKIWVPPNYSPASGVVEGAALYQELYDQFQAENPEITLTYEALDPGPVGLQQLLTAANAGNLPDATIIDGQWAGRLVQSNVLVGLTDLWPEADRADFQPAALASQTFDGQAYAVMFQTGMRGLFYRPSILKAAGVETFPGTWEELLAANETLKAAGMSTIMLPGKPANEPAMIFLLSIFWGLGGELVDDTGKPIFAEGENAAIMEKTFALYKQLVDEGAMLAEASVMDEAAMRPYFYSGEVAAVGQSSSSVRQIWSEMPDTVSDMDVAGVPLPDGKTPVTIVGGFSYALTATDPEKQAAAWKFIQFMTSTEHLGKTNEVLGHIPLRASIWESSEFFSTNPIMIKFKALYDAESRVRPSVPIYTTISTAITTELSSVITGAVTPADAVKRANEVVTLEYDRQEQR